MFRRCFLILNQLFQTEIALLHMFQKMDHFFSIHSSILKFL